MHLEQEQRLAAAFESVVAGESCLPGQGKKTAGFGAWVGPMTDRAPLMSVPHPALVADPHVVRFSVGYESGWDRGVPVGIETAAALLEGVFQVDPTREPVLELLPVLGADEEVVGVCLALDARGQADPGRHEGAEPAVGIIGDA